MYKLDARFTLPISMAIPLVSLVLLFACVYPAWSQTAANSPLSRKLTQAERRAERDILVRTGPLGMKIVPSRNKELKASYVGMSTKELWKHLLESRQLAVIGVKEPSRTRGFFGGKSIVSERTLKSASEQLLNTQGVSKPRGKMPKEWKMPVMPDGRPYPAVIVRLDSPKVLGIVRGLPFVDFIEPLYPHVVYQDGIGGCDFGPYVGNPSDGTLTVDSASNVVPWNYTHHRIPQAWRLFPDSTAPGFGVDFFETDTGVYPSQRQFVEVFAPSTTQVSRSFSQVPWTRDTRVKCSHGTRIAGVAAAPADGSTSPNIVGIAWGASLVSEMVGHGVVHFDTSAPALAGAIMDAARSTFNLPMRKRVLLMAWGMPWESATVRDAIVSAYDSNPNLILVAASGTIVPNVVFPATMRRETVAVSLVEAPNTARPSYTLIPITSLSNTVAYGGEVDFVAVNSVLTGFAIPTTAKGINSKGESVDSDGNLVLATTLLPTETIEVTSIGGSSSAVSIIGGGIALAWSRMEDLTRDQLLGRLVAASSCGAILGLSAACRDGNDNRVVGAGVPDFYNAAGGARSIFIDGLPSLTPGTPTVLTASMDGNPSFYYWSWSTGDLGETTSINLMPGESLTVELTAKNRFDGMTLTASRTIVAVPMTARTLFANTTLGSFATFLDGHRISSMMNAGATLPAGCFVTGVAGQELVVGGPTPGAAFGTPVATANRGNRGFSVIRTAFGSQNLDVLVTGWHDGFSAIKVRPVYFVQEPSGIDCNSGGATQATP